MRDCDLKDPFYAPSIDDILAIAKCSKDPSFSKDKFFRYLEDYRNEGLCCGRPKNMTKAREEYYTKLREQKIYEASLELKQNNKITEAKKLFVSNMIDKY